MIEDSSGPTINKHDGEIYNITYKQEPKYWPSRGNYDHQEYSASKLLQLTFGFFVTVSCNKGCWP